MSKKVFYPLLENPYRKKDLNSAIKVIKTGKITIGKHTERFEKSFSKKIKTKFSLMVNSGSSANLLASFALINHSPPPFLHCRAVDGSLEPISP